MEVRDRAHSAPPHAALRSEALVKLTMFRDDIARELVVLVTTVFSEKVPVSMNDALQKSMKPPPARAVFHAAATLVSETLEARTKAPPPNTALQLKKDTPRMMMSRPGLKTARQPPEACGGGASGGVERGKDDAVGGDG